MRSGRTYEVFVDGKPVGLVGSTIRTLKQRRGNRYIARFGSTVELRLIREVPRHESEDDVSYNFHLKAAEALDIARKKTYTEDGGLNKISPLIQAMGRRLLDTELGRLGGLAGGRKGGLISGRRSVENGQLAAMRTKEHQSTAGHLGGLKGGPIGIRMLSREDKARGGRNGKHEDRVRAGRTTVKRGYLTKEHQSNAARIRIQSPAFKQLNHIRWHVTRGIVNPNCFFCFLCTGNAV